MKPENGTAEDRMLDSTLRTWQIQAPLPPRFREQVWQRITREEARAPLAVWQQVAGWISQALARPSLAVGYVTLLLFLGLVAGYWQARAENERSLEDLSSRYVQMIDPYQPSRH
jgi:hypothetical protein